jgi:integrase
MTTRRDRGDAKVIELKDRPAGSRYVGRVWVTRDGQKYRKSVYGASAAEVREKMAVEKRRAADGLEPTDKETTAAGYLTKWIDRQHRRVKRGDLRERTAARYESLIRIHVLPVIGSKLLASLTRDDVERCLDRMQDRGLGPTTRHHVGNALRIALSDAVAVGRLARNPAKLADLPAPVTRRPRVPTDAEYARIIRAVDGDRLGPLFVFIASTGCRLGEALGLRWQDVHWDREEIEFTQTVGRVNGRDVFGKPKTEASEAAIPMTPPARSALNAQKAAQDSGLTGAPPMLLADKGEARGPLVFTAIDGGPLNGSYVTHRFQTLLTRAGLPKLRVHDLRHLYVSLLHAQDVPIEVISGLVRHANPQVTRTIYLHLRPDTKREAAGRIAHLFSQTGS